MSGRAYTRWTPERLAQCRSLYEEGTPNADIGRLFEIAPATVAVMAWQRKWKRLAKLQPLQSDLARAQAVRGLAGDAGEEDAVDVADAPSKEERAFNGRLRQTIKEYWQQRGRKIWLSSEAQPGGVLGIRSKSVNGMPVE